MDHTTIRGRIDYLSRRPGMEGKRRGGETFLITKHGDGRRTLRATCIIDENSPRVLRDSITNLAPDWTPMGGFVQISVDDAFVGSTWFDFRDGMARAHGYNVREGHFSQEIRLAERPCFFGTHPIQADALTTRCFDLSQGPGRQVIPYFLMCSTHHRGADGPKLVTARELNLTFIGEEELTVKAGTFQALHFLVGANTDDEYMGTDRHPPYHVWVTADGDHIFLKGHVTGYMQTYYELAVLERGEGDI
ncbi:hypothetical protein [Niveispirillum fermenti]|uniref:hypothetical protein n=1 Tax=Niveispirillum fermenti TaxID=1233113 RepID=UPI003A89AEDD